MNGGFAYRQALLLAIQLVVVLTLVSPLIVTPSSLFPLIVGKAVYMRLLIEIAFALWLIAIIIFPDLRPSKSRILIAFALWLAISAVAALFGASPTRSFWSNYERMQGVVDLAHWFAFVLVVSSVFRARSEWRLLFTANLFMSAVVSAVGVAAWHGMIDLGIALHEDRVHSTLGNATFLGTYALVSVTIGLGLLIRPSRRKSQPPPRSAISRRHRRRRAARRGKSERSATPLIGWMLAVRVLIFAAILLNLWALWLTGSRAGLIALIVALLVFGVALLVGPVSTRMKWAAAVAVVFVLVGAASIAAIVFTDNFDPLVQSSQLLMRIRDDGGSVQDRIAAVEIGLKAFAERPILGWGPENFSAMWGKFLEPGHVSSQNLDYAHNKAVEELSGKGVAGFAAFVILWLAMARAAALALWRERAGGRAEIAAYCAAGAAFFAQSMVQVETPTSMLLFALIVAYFAQEEREAAGDAGWGWHSAPAWADAAWRKISRWNRPSQPSGSKSGERDSEPPPLFAGVWRARVLAAAVIAALAAATVAYSYQPMAAARILRNANLHSGTWTDRLEISTAGIDRFPPLGNYERIRLIESAAREAPDMPDEEYALALQVVEAEGGIAIEAEPFSWQALAALARFYQQAALRDPSQMDAARLYTDELIRMAPNLRQSKRVAQWQEELEAARSGR